MPKCKYKRRYVMEIIKHSTQKCTYRDNEVERCIIGQNVKSVTNGIPPQALWAFYKGPWSIVYRHHVKMCLPLLQDILCISYILCVSFLNSSNGDRAKRPESREKARREHQIITLYKLHIIPVDSYQKFMNLIQKITKYCQSSDGSQQPSNGAFQ